MLLAGGSNPPHSPRALSDCNAQKPTVKLIERCATVSKTKELKKCLRAKSEGSRQLGKPSPVRASSPFRPGTRQQPKRVLVVAERVRRASSPAVAYAATHGAQLSTPVALPVSQPKERGWPCVRRGPTHMRPTLSLPLAPQKLHTAEADISLAVPLVRLCVWRSRAKETDATTNRVAGGRGRGWVEEHFGSVRVTSDIACGATLSGRCEDRHQHHPSRCIWLQTPGTAVDGCV